jgi:hypothetical protein
MIDGHCTYAYGKSFAVVLMYHLKSYLEKVTLIVMKVMQTWYS